MVEAIWTAADTKYRRGVDGQNQLKYLRPNLKMQVRMVAEFEYLLPTRIDRCCDMTVHAVIICRDLDIGFGTIQHPLCSCYIVHY